MSLKHIVVGKVQELVIDDMYLNILLLLVVAKLCTNEDSKAALAADMSFWRLSSALANFVLRLAEGFLFCFSSERMNTVKFMSQIRGEPFWPFIRST